MKNFLRLFFTFLAAPLFAEIAPDSVAVLYNKDVTESEELAKAYAEARSIPEQNLIGLSLPNTAEISRADFSNKLRNPLAAEFLRRGWLTRERLPDGSYKLIKSEIKVLLTLRGVPYKIPTAVENRADENGEMLPRWHLEQDDASVDSELTLLGNTSYPTEGPVDNPYFRADSTVTNTNDEPILLVGRIDGPSWDDCHRLIKDAVDVEETGLWGLTYLDFAKKTEGGYLQGDEWIESIARTNREEGLPTIIDRHYDTFVTNYPMSQAAVYFGWYTTDCNGPLLNPEFQFSKGAVAVHLHSFSATDLRNAKKHWAGPLIAKGAAATVGNVWEPFLQLTHHFDIFHDRLLNGYSLIEASYMALPALSWQAVVIGDPLYRPYAQLNESPEVSESETPFIFLRNASQTWADDQETMTRKIRTEAAKTSSGLLYEALGLALKEEGEIASATAFFNSASKNYLSTADKLRQELHLIDMARQAGRQQDAINRVKTALKKYAKIPEGKSLSALLTILDPPAPPQVDPAKMTQAKQ